VPLLTNKKMATILDVPNDVWLGITQFEHRSLARWYELRRVCKAFQQRLRSTLCNFQVTLDRPVLVANLEPGVRKLRLVKCDGPTLHCISHLHLRELSLDPISDLRWDALMPLQSLRVLRVGFNVHVLIKKPFAIRSSDFLCSPELQSLTLSHCRFSRGAIEQLRRLTTLKHFALFSSYLGDVRFGELASLTNAR
jgi:hypothetical protein